GELVVPRGERDRSGGQAGSDAISRSDVVGGQDSLLLSAKRRRLHRVRHFLGLPFVRGGEQFSGPFVALPDRLPPEKRANGFHRRRGGRFLLALVQEMEPNQGRLGVIVE